MKQKPYQLQDFKEVLDWASDRSMNIIDSPQKWEEAARLRYDQAKKKELVILTQKDVEYLVCSALEGGSNYWYDIGAKSSDKIYKMTKEMRGKPFVDRLLAALNKGVHVNIFDVDEPVSEIINGKKVFRKKLGTLTEFSWAKAEKLMLQKYRQHLGSVLCNNNDATTGDVFFQLTVMGELVYG